MGLEIILITDKKGNIGYDDKLLYWFPKDLKNFKDFTLNKTVVMGRRTWESLPNKLPNRKNIVLSKTLQWQEGEKKPDIIIENTEQIILLSKKEDVVVIGGKRLYEEMFMFANEINLTIVEDEHQKSNVEVEMMEFITSGDFGIKTYDTTTYIDKKTNKEFILHNYNFIRRKL